MTGLLARSRHWATPVQILVGLFIATTIGLGVDTFVDRAGAATDTDPTETPSSGSDTDGDAAASSAAPTSRVEPVQASSAPTNTSIQEPESSPEPSDSSTSIGSTPNDGRPVPASELLTSIPIELEHRGSGYDRDLFAVWIDSDGNGCNTRDEVLLAEANERIDDASGCGFGGAATWLSRYDGAVVTSASDLDVDHVVALKEAWDSGAWAWTPDQRIAYANDLDNPRTLIAVTAESNRSKGDRDPSNWIPDHGLCDFLGDWIAVKAAWSMSMDPSEHGRIGNLLDDRCPELMITPSAPRL